VEKEASTGFIGFTSPLDFINSLVGIKSWVINSIFAVIGATTTFITDYMFNDPNAVWTLWILMFGDWTTGIIKSIIKKRFVSFKIWRMPLYFVATSFVLSISWNMAKGNILFYLLPGIVMSGFYAVYFVSLLENLGEIGLMPKQLAKVLKSKFGLKKLIEKDFSNESNKS